MTMSTTEYFWRVLSKPAASLGSIIFTAILTASPTLADVHITQKTRTYSATGSTIGNVVRSMKWRGPVHRESGRQALALADFRYRVRLETKEEKGHCRVERVDIDLKTFLNIPKLSSRAKLSRRDSNRWRSIERMIRNHENRHVAYYRQFAHALHRRLARLTSRSGCTDLRRKARKIEREELARDRHRNRAYDRRSYRGFNKRLRQLAR